MIAAQKSTDWEEGLTTSEALDHPSDACLQVLAKASLPHVALHIDPSRSRPLGVLDGNGLELPFPDGSTAFLTLTVPSVWLKDAGLVPLLATIRRLLAPDGEAVFVVKHPRQHGNPAKASRLLSKVHGWISTVLGRRQFRRVLAASGFPDHHCFSLHRAADGRLTEVRPYGAAEEAWQPPATYSSTARRLRTLKSWGGDFAVRASGRPLERSAVVSCLASAAAQVAASTRSQPAFSVERLLVTPKEKIVVLGKTGSKRTVLRIPLSHAAHQANQRHLAAIRALKAIPRGAVAPAPLAEGQAGRFSYSLESCVPGHPMRSSPATSGTLASVEALIRRLHPEPAAMRIDDELLHQLVSGPLSTLRPLIGHQKAAALQEFFRANLLERRVVLGLTHGDLSLSNIFVADGGISGVIDWDDSSPVGVAVLDAISHLCSRHFKRTRNFAEAFFMLAERDWPSSDEMAFLDRCYEFLKTDASSHRALVFLYWLRLVGAQTGYWFARDAAFAGTRVQAVVNRIIGT